MSIARIVSVTGRQIFDSRATPTVEAEVTLDTGITACASVPSGASTGTYEAVELRDQEDAYHGKSVFRAVRNINTAIAEALRGIPACEQALVDETMLRLDGTPNKANLGANATLAVSLACAKAAAAQANMEFFRYLGGIYGVTLPVPMMNILNGGAHADNNVDIQEFMIMPIGAGSFRRAMQMGTEIYFCLKQLLREKGLFTAVGDEGGFAPNLQADEQALALLVDAIEAAGYKPGEDASIALDAAASEWATQDGYCLPKKQRKLSRDALCARFAKLCQDYPVISVEDPLSEEDFDGFAQLTATLGQRCQIVGDDLFVTNPARLADGIRRRSANAVLVKPNQIGTLSETMRTVRLAQQHGYRTILSHRSGETEDTSIADIAVALGAGQIKTGAPARSDRVCKYNRLLKIEMLLGDAAQYGFAQL